MKVMISDICEAFQKKAVGSKVMPSKHKQFMAELRKAIRKHDFPKERIFGQAVIDLPSKVNKWVSPGTWGRNSVRYTAKDFVIRGYRGEYGMYMKRTPEMKSVRVRCVVYTLNAYINDPDYDPIGNEAARVVEHFGFSGSGDNYVLVAVLGDCDLNKSTVSYSRFVKNLAGANNEYAVMDKGELVGLAKKVVDYRSKYIGVAD